MTPMLVILILVCVGMPLLYAVQTWRLDAPDRAAWLLRATDATVFVALIMVLGRWDVAGFYTRYILLALFAIALARSFWRHRDRPWRDGASPPLWKQFAPLLSLVFVGVALVYVLGGMTPREGARPLAFPLADGRFVITHGGGNRILNHHAGHRAQSHAVDITAVNTAGFRATGLLPHELADYAIFDKPVLSPCDGEVTAASDGLPDLTPPERDSGQPAGNHVILDCGGLIVELAHLRKGSVAVEPGRRIETGTLIGRVGNSGNTTEPHLHVHATDPITRRAVPVTFDGRTPLRNMVFVRASGG